MRLWLLFLAGLSSACGVGDPADGRDSAFDAIRPSYALHVAPILEDYCVPCHNGAGLIEGGVELDTYVGAYGSRIKNACTAIGPDLVEAFADVLTLEGHSTPCKLWEVDSMPVGAFSRLSRDQALILLRWIEVGAPR